MLWVSLMRFTPLTLCCIVFLFGCNSGEKEIEVIVYTHHVGSLLKVGERKVEVREAQWVKDDDGLWKGHPFGDYGHKLIYSPANDDAVQAIRKHME